jgi:hypothetical protein
MQATLVLCDFAEVDSSTGKVHILGAGWSLTGPAPSPHSVVAFLRVPPDRARSPIPITLRLLDQAHQVVEVQGVGGMQRLEISGQVEMNLPESWNQASTMSGSFAVNFGALPLQAGRTYMWCVEVDGKELASAEFIVRSA